MMRGQKLAPTQLNERPKYIHCMGKERVHCASPLLATARIVRSDQRQRRGRMERVGKASGRKTWLGKRGMEKEVRGATEREGGEVRE